MTGQFVPSLDGRILRVDLTSGRCSDDSTHGDRLRSYLGGTALGMRYLYDELGSDVAWSDPRNRFFLGSGPLGGTIIGGSGAVSIVTTGAMTGGATSSQANGYMGAFLKFPGFDGVLIQGASEDWKYLYIYDGEAELRDAGHFLGKDTWETEEAIKEEMGFSTGQMSVFCIGPAGESVARFAALVGDRGHVAGHNGLGAVLGSKKLKAVAVARGRGRVEVKDPEGLRKISEEIWERAEKSPNYTWGTSTVFSGAESRGFLPVKNYTTNIFPEHARFMAQDYRAKHQMTRHPCWACRSAHCNLMKLKEGPYAGYEGEEPEYEQWAAFGPVIGNTDLGGAMVLANEVDRLGFDANEMGWLLGWVTECYENKLLSRHDLDGLEMTWGNVEAARKLIRNIAGRRGFGDILAEGVMRASKRIGGEAANRAIYTLEGNTPRGHDHRGGSYELFDTSVATFATMEANPMLIPDRPHYGLPEKIGPFDPVNIARGVARNKEVLQLQDSLVTCRFITLSNVDLLRQALEAATGWDFRFQEAVNVGRRAVNMARVFNLCRGIGNQMERPSQRYGSAPVDGPNVGMSIMLRIYYENMGWDRERGVPLPETLGSLGLDDSLADLPGNT